MITVRKIGIHDLSQYRNDIAGFIQIVFYNTFGERVDSTLIEEKLSSLNNHISDGTAYPYGAFDGEDMVGFLWGYYINGIFEELFHIGYIVVSESMRNRGIGSMLVKEVEEQVINDGIADSIVLNASYKNKTAIDFYLSDGFYYDQIILKKKLMS